MKPLTVLGFTLVELMVTIALMAMVLTLAIPSYKETVRNAILTSRMNEFVATLNYARSEAVKRSMNVTVATADGSANWEHGWRVFYTDTNGVNQILRVHESLTANYTLHNNGNPNPLTQITFGSDGETSNSASFALCDNSDGSGRPKRGTAKLIIINLVGRIRVAQDSNMDGIPEDGNGNDLTTCF